MEREKDTGWLVKWSPVKIPKKGSLRDCSNWRVITLLSIPSKVLKKIIIQRMSDRVDQQLRKEQAGFLKSRDALTKYLHYATSLSSVRIGSWIGNVLRWKPANITRSALHWTSYRKGKRPKNTWRRAVQGKMKTLNHSWSTIQNLAKNRHECGTFVAAIYASRDNGSK